MSPKMGKEREVTMLFQDITIIDEHFQVRENMFVGVKDDKIAYVGTEKPGEDFGEVYPGKGRLLMNAFYNAHGHTPMTTMRGYGENLPLSDWLNQKIFPFEAKQQARDIYYGMLLGIGEMIRFGTVSTTDMYMYGESMAQAVLETGVKSNLGFAMVCFDDRDFYELPEYRETKYMYENYHGKGNGRLLIDSSIHAEYTSNPKVAGQFAQYSLELGTNMNLHLSETRKEHEECKQRHGKTPARYFYDLGVFDSHATAAHCVWLEGEDFDLLKEKDVTVASCPVSNVKLASGICDVKKLLSMGINVAIGTDSVASNNSLNMIEEMKFFALLQKVKHYDATAVTPQQAIYAATRAGALAQGRQDCGLLKEGGKADLIVLDIQGPHMRPVYDLKNNLVYSADGGDVALTMCDGKILYENGEYKTLDVERAAFEVAQTGKRILSDLSRK